MRINVFKTGLFESLKTHNAAIIKAFLEVAYQKDGKWFYKQEPDREVSYWFNPFSIRSIPLPLLDPNIYPINHDVKWVLLDNYSNYATMFVINEIYRDRKDVMIEDVCCGPAKLTFFLSKLGFHNFSLFDNFSQMRQELMDAVMSGIPHRLNQPPEDIKPEVFVQIAYPRIVRPIHKTVDLICVYPLLWNVFDFDGMGYRILCRDSDDTMIFYAHERKWQEFHDKLKPYEEPSIRR